MSTISYPHFVRRVAIDHMRFYESDRGGYQLTRLEAHVRRFPAWPGPNVGYAEIDGVTCRFETEAVMRVLADVSPST